MVSAQYLIFLTIVETFVYTFHGSILLLLFCKRKTAFKGPFYAIFRIVLFADLTSFILVVLAFRVPLLAVEFFKKEIIIPSCILLLTPYFLVIQFIGHTFMALNRFTLLWFPIKYERIWRKDWYTPVLFLLPIGHLCYRFHEPGNFVFPATVNTVLMLYKNPAMNALTFLVSAYIFSVTTVFAAIFNIFALIKFYFYKQTTNNANMKEKRLLFLSCLIFVAQVFRTSYSFSRQIFSSDENVTAFLIAALPFITDAFALTGSISLLLLSPTTRKEYAKFYFFICKSTSESNSTSIYPFTITNKPRNW